MANDKPLFKAETNVDGKKAVDIYIPQDLTVDSDNINGFEDQLKKIQSDPDASRAGAAKKLLDMLENKENHDRNHDVQNRALTKDGYANPDRNAKRNYQKFHFEGKEAEQVLELLDKAKISIQEKPLENSLRLAGRVGQDTAQEYHRYTAEELKEYETKNPDKVYHGVFSLDEAEKNKALHVPDNIKKYLEKDKSNGGHKGLKVDVIELPNGYTLTGYSVANSEDGEVTNKLVNAKGEIYTPHYKNKEAQQAPEQQVPQPQLQPTVIQPSHGNSGGNERVITSTPVDPSKVPNANPAHDHTQVIVSKPDWQGGAPGDTITSKPGLRKDKDIDPGFDGHNTSKSGPRIDVDPGFDPTPHANALGKLGVTGGQEYNGGDASPLATAMAKAIASSRTV